LVEAEDSGGAGERAYEIAPGTQVNSLRGGPTAGCNAGHWVRVLHKERVKAWAWREAT
jgi:hypothetical protein